MLILFTMNLILAMTTVKGFPGFEDYQECMDMPSSYNYSTTKEELSIHDVINDISSFVSNFSKRFSDMNTFINDHKNETQGMDIKYFLFTSSRPKSPYSLKLSESSLSGSGFDPRVPTTFIIHGYSRNMDINNSALSVMKDFLLKRTPHNVIMMNYTEYCQGPYTEAVQYSYLVAMNLANLVQFIAENSFVPISQLHLIGVSMGAHISGNVGMSIPGIGRITGLDPAGPLFGIFPNDYRLNDEDAMFVDVIHTGAASFPLGLGLPEPIGDLNFYPNGGEFQPGCNAQRSFTPNSAVGIETVNAIRCCHSRAVFLFMESFCNSECQFEGISCDSYENFQNGSCSLWNSATAIMGINAKRTENLLPGTKLYLNTNSKLPYCKLE